MNNRPELETLWKQLLEKQIIGKKILSPFTITRINDDETNSDIPIEVYVKFYNDVIGDNLTEDTLVSKMISEFPEIWKPPLEVLSARSRVSYTLYKPKIIRVTQRMWRLGICSLSNSVFDARKGSVYQKMSYPIFYYNISSAISLSLWNTSMKGQVSKDAVIQRYRDDLNKGCRYLEIDCIDGNNDGTLLLGIGLGSLLHDYKTSKSSDVIFIKGKYSIYSCILFHCVSLAQMSWKWFGIVGSRLFRILSY